MGPYSEARSSLELLPVTAIYLDRTQKMLPFPLRKKAKVVSVNQWLEAEDRKKQARNMVHFKSERNLPLEHLI